MHCDLCLLDTKVSTTRKTKSATMDLTVKIHSGSLV